MNADRNLLFAVLALQTDLIDLNQFVEACTAWTANKSMPLADVLVERGWILASDREHVDYLLERKLRKCGGDLRASLIRVPEEIKRSLAALDDEEIHSTFAGLTPSDHRPSLETVDLLPDRYSLTTLHGSGGIGRIWLARDAALGRDVALKELRPERAGDALLRARFMNEARITGQLEHPGIVPVYELSRHRETDLPFYTMRFVKGRTLSEAIHAYHEKRRASEADSLEFLWLLNAFVTVCNTIAYAHSRGVIHRDLKGQNVVLGDFGEVVVLDWGLAKRMGGVDAELELPSGALSPDDSTQVEHTFAGQILGTPAYMAPEQAAGLPELIDHRTDVYGLGAILYELLTGQPPFRGRDALDLLRQVREESPEPPRQLCPDVPAELEQSCLQALAKLPGDRHASATALAQEIQGWQEHQRRQAVESLRQSEALYQSLVESIPLQVWRKDRHCRFTFVNKGFREALGRSAAELVGKTDFDIFPPDLAEKYRADDLWVVNNGKALEADEDHVTASGARLRVHVVKRPFLDADGEVVGIQGIFWDVTERDRLEQVLTQVTAELNAARQLSASPHSSD